MICIGDVGYIIKFDLGRTRLKSAYVNFGKYKVKSMKLIKINKPIFSFILPREATNFCGCLTFVIRTNKGKFTSKPIVVNKPRINGNFLDNVMFIKTKFAEEINEEEYFILN